MYTVYLLKISSKSIDVAVSCKLLKMVKMVSFSRTSACRFLLYHRCFAMISMRFSLCIQITDIVI